MAVSRIGSERQDVLIEVDEPRDPIPVGGCPDALSVLLQAVVSGDRDAARFELGDGIGDVGDRPTTQCSRGWATCATAVTRNMVPLAPNTQA